MKDFLMMFRLHIVTAGNLMVCEKVEIKRENVFIFFIFLFILDVYYFISNTHTLVTDCNLRKRYTSKSLQIIEITLNYTILH